jgi:hypothetical protein
MGSRKKFTQLCIILPGQSKIVFQFISPPSCYPTYMLMVRYNTLTGGLQGGANFLIKSNFGIMHFAQI